MERLLQYLDDLDDFVYAIALTWEKIRLLGRFSFLAIVMVILQALGIYAAIEYPPVAVSAGSLLVVGLLYRGAVHNVHDIQISS
jgi:hypothetical protein